MGFNFREIPQIEIGGKLYECDPENNDLLNGVKKGWPVALRAAQAQIALNLEAQKSAANPLTEAEKEALETALLEANQATFLACRSLIEGTLGTAEYLEIFAGRRPNTNEHMNLCAYIIAFIMHGREEYVSEFRAAVEEDLKPDAAATTAGQNSEPASADKLSLVDEKRRARAGFKAFLRRKG